MNILITGGAGFIGSHTAALLTRQKYNVVVVDNLKTGDLSNLKGVRCAIEICDILDFKRLERIFFDYMPAAVIHLAAQSAITTSIQYPELDVRVNTLGTLNVIKLCNRYNVRKLVFSSTAAVYREKPEPFLSMTENHPCQPTTPYGIDKLAAEHFIRSMIPNHVIFRYGNVYGPKQRPIGENQVVARALRHFLHGDDFKVVGDGKQKRDFVFVEDVAWANAEAVKSYLKTNISDPDLKGTYNLCTGKSYSVNAILRFLEDHYGVPGYGWTHTKESDPRGSVYMNNNRIRAALGMSFIPLHVGLKKTIEAEDVKP